MYLAIIIFLRVRTLFCCLTAQNVLFILASLNKGLGWEMGRDGA